MTGKSQIPFVSAARAVGFATDSAYSRGQIYLAGPIPLDRSPSAEVTENDTSHGATENRRDSNFCHCDKFDSLFFDYWRQHRLRIKVARIFNTYGATHAPQRRAVWYQILLSRRCLVALREGLMKAIACFEDLLKDQTVGPLIVHELGEKAF
jgi:hypothetical protein